MATGADEDYVSRTAADQSHFNTLVVRTYWVRLFDPFHEPMPGAPYQVTLGERRWEGEADEDAWVKLRYTQPEARVLVEWGRIDPQASGPAGDAGPDDPGSLLGWSDGPLTGLFEEAQSEPDEDVNVDQAQQEADRPGDGNRSGATARPSPYNYQLELHLDLHAEDAEDAIGRRLHNLGFDWSENLAENVRIFQRVFNWAPTGQAEEIAQKLCQWHDDCEPERWPAPQPGPAGATIE